MSFPGITNHEVEIPGSTVTACLAEWTDGSGKWTYSLWDEENELISTGDLNFTPMSTTAMPVTPSQVARVAFLLDVEYARTV